MVFLYDARTIKWCFHIMRAPLNGVFHNARTIKWCFFDGCRVSSAARAGTRGRTPRASGARCRGTGRPAAPGPRPRRDGATPAPRRADGVTLALHWATWRGLPNFHCHVCLALSGHVTLHCWQIYSVSENIVANQCHIAHSTPSEAVRTRGESAVCQRSASGISRCNSYRETALQQKTRL